MGRKESPTNLLYVMLLLFLGKENGVVLFMEEDCDTFRKGRERTHTHSVFSGRHSINYFTENSNAQHSATMMKRDMVRIDNDPNILN